jgi:hypothetical protein
MVRHQNCIFSALFKSRWNSFWLDRFQLSQDESTFTRELNFEQVARLYRGKHYSPLIVCSYRHGGTILPVWQHFKFFFIDRVSPPDEFLWMLEQLMKQAVSLQRQNETMNPGRWPGLV